MNTHSLVLLDKVLKLSGESAEMTARSKRLSELLKEPDDEQTSSWFMCVPSCFNSALDILQTPRKEGGKECLVWTQGSAFSFKVGDILYDTSKAYSTWSEALKHMAFCVRVEQASDATPPKKGKTQQESIQRISGFIRCSILIPDKHRITVKEAGEFQMTQDEFVRFLIRGAEGSLKNKFPKR